MALKEKSLMSGESLLSTWQRTVIPRLEHGAVPAACVPDVTLLAYFFWDDDRINTLFYTIQSAFLCARHFLGMLPATLVVNRTTPAMIWFCDEHHILLQIDATLTGGVPRMNRDCVQDLHRRFDTDYVLIIQSDGFPLRDGLEAFVGKYDYVGAPFGGFSWYTDIVFPPSRYGVVGNGGFTLRSRKLCEMASTFYRKYFSRLPYTWLTVDDVFYCKTLPRFSKACRETVVYAPPEVAGQFSFETNRHYYSPTTCPLGFHSASGFERVMADFGTHINASLGITRKA